jgi:tetratricopeptide (TPR) repeat protein
VASTYFSIGGIWNTKGQYDKALEYFEKDLKISIDYYGESHPNVASTKNSIGKVLIEIDEFAKANVLFEETLVQFIKFYGENHSNTAALKRNLAQSLTGLQRYDEAKELFIESLRILESRSLDNDLVLARALMLYAECQRLSKQPGEALKLIERAVIIFHDALGEMHLETADAYFIKGRILEDMFNLEGAIEYFKVCYQIRLGLLDQNHLKLIVAKNKLENKYN